VPDLFVGGKRDLTCVVAVQADRQDQLQLASRRLVAQPALQPGADQVQLGFGHRALQPEQQSIVEIRRRVDAVGVGDQRRGQRAQVKQLMPIRRTACQPGGLQREDQPDMTEPDLGNQLLEPKPLIG